MSEFNESYHLRSERIEDAVDVLRSAKRKGYVYPPMNGWITFVAEESNFQPEERIFAAAPHQLLHFVFAEDYEWSFTLFDHTKVVSSYSCHWEDDVTIDDSEYSREALQRFILPKYLDVFANFERQLHPEDVDEIFEAQPAELFAQALGLEHYRWVAYDYVAHNIHDVPGDFPGCD